MWVVNRDARTFVRVRTHITERFVLKLTIFCDVYEIVVTLNIENSHKRNQHKCCWVVSNLLLQTKHVKFKLYFS